MTAKIKTIIILILSGIALALTFGLFDPFSIRKPKPIQDDLDNEREKEKAKTENITNKSLIDLATHDPGDDRDDALKSLLDKDYPKR
jgi:hypothetical protein